MKSKLRKLVKQKHILHTLKDSSPKMQCAILKNSNDQLVDTIIEIVFNVLEGHHRIPKKTRLGLEKYKTTMRKLACVSRTRDSKRKILQKGGNLIPLLLQTVLGGVIGKILQ